MKLGRKAVKTDSRTLRLGKYLTASLPAPPNARDWTRGLSSWGMMRNDTLGDCTIASLGHAIQVWSANVGQELTVSDDNIQDAYQRWCGYDPKNPSTDGGGIELDVMNNFKKDGLAGHALTGFASMTPTNLTEIRQAINLFGGAYIGLSLPLSAQNQTVWDANNFWTRKDSRYLPGSWGGHAVFVPKYDGNSFTCITWGGLKTMTVAFWNKYCDEAHVLFGQDWLTNLKVSPSGFDMSTLISDLGLFN